MQTFKEQSEKARLHNKMTLGGLLVTLGVVYGDIGTSPLYVMKSIIAGNGGMGHFNTDFVIGSVSLIFWTITLLTTVKYVGIALRADNKGEGGIFALYTLIRRRALWLIVPAMVGGAALLADGMLTPAVTVTTAIEGLKGVQIGQHIPITNQETVIIWTMIILSLLFFIQRFGTSLIGKAFGPIMLLWFTFIGVLGLSYIVQSPSILKALNPYYAFHLLVSPDNKVGIFILGSVFLATTGAEALYSDLGHVGRGNIYGSWPYVKICLVLNYFGQAVWIINNAHVTRYNHLNDFNPFFEIMPSWLRLFGIIMATLAAIIASQALISGSFTLVSEAIRLKILPRLHIVYPTNTKGQLYIPAVNLILWVACLAVVLFFQTSSHMEAAYGLAITVTMLMTTLLLYQYLRSKKANPILAWLMVLFFGSIETIFFISSAAKFLHGGYVTAFIAFALVAIMFIWQYGDYLKNNNSYRTEDVSLLAYKNQLKQLKEDTSYPLFTTNLVYMTRVKDKYRIKKEILYSILDKRPKRAEVYWFVTVNVTDEPYTAAYTTEMFGTDYMVNVQLYLGFRMEQRVNVFLRQVITEMMKNGKLPRQPQQYTTIPDRAVGDFSFVMIHEDLSPETQINGWEKAIIQARLFLQKIALTPIKWFGLEYADTMIEHVPLVLGKTYFHKLRELHHLDKIPPSDTGEEE
ncbi:KUP/HAK/KT family potassium transporter [Loigolactobacillus bifermentans]|uniref:Probable potassium transport system protein Kup n=1 Tax=Loigolactobacillus bifermentans DSM 20003 TaxID=1423726 RepID=A0A0R1GKC3_9LACO|nr:KUP/HAK/KT family potassium transporter [Loigolactobacillus bifermentans]KRK34459.1 K+ transporter [Loigolactobacillus bifermentans DSM 20003]QGG60167.1 portal protein [Loigolactobacillus bifermentans]